MTGDTDDQVAYKTTTATEYTEDDVPLAVDPGEGTPFIVIPRGGVQEVGRSCYQLETKFGTYLVDAGLNQGDGGQFPDFRGIDEGQIDAVFLTHAHIDHVGALPVIESRNLLSPRAPIITTRPTEALASTLLKDSLKIHKEKAEKPGREQLYTDADVRKVLDRFVPRGYIRSDIQDYVPNLPEQETLTFEFGNAGHLLGSAWIAFETMGSRVVFSGDLGGRSNHLPDIEDPPKADSLFLEATYGGTENHDSASETRTEIYSDAITAARNQEPVLIPSFGVGRSQELLYIFKNRLHQLDNDTRSQIQLIYDGMAVGATNTYNQHAHGEFASESIRNLRVSNGEDQPFLPDQADAGYHIDRQDALDNERTPIIIAPSGMLAGGWAPSYLVEFADRYDHANIFLCGFQAEGTPGRQLEDAIDAEAGTIEITLPALRLGEGVPDTDDGTTVEIPTEWITRYSGLSAHGARQTLREFARMVSPEEITLVHGEPDQQRALAANLADKVETVTGIRVGGMMDATPVRPRTDDDSDSALTDRPATKLLDEAEHELTFDETTAATDMDHSDLVDRMDTLEMALRTIDAELGVARHDDTFSEAEIRSIVRDEMRSLLRDEGLID
ncbi:MBL fold metallo-hydrolase [Halobiforma nitratireducens]|uniref:Metal-dependent RNase n=1 Tax=Halobiforma nitratireducens JCM 10879 TaxID=1227454 RepID=M0M1N0_9EURY|nr:MBL fold metallo-hydrolase [Halobiforma nitratireducens]EMA39318.1 metal-dependent RNase [Halobiforma nitratireducens JCM 10879]